jgi:hypothetical protein
MTNVGTNTVFARVVDSGGLVAASNVRVIVTNAAPIVNTFPVVVMTAPTNGLTVITNTSVTCRATATDAEDGLLTVYYTDSQQGALGSGASVTYTPTLGTHVITAKATDTAGAVGQSSVTIQVNTPDAPPTQLVMTLTANKTMYTNKEKAYLTASVRTQAGAAVSGATCNLRIKVPNRGQPYTKTLTTGTDGTASFYFQMARTQMGIGPVTVNGTATKPGYLTGVAPTLTFTIY